MRKVQLFSAIEQLEKKRGLIVIDVITLGGIVKPLAEAAQISDRSIVTRLWELSARTSVKENEARALAVIAHADCRGNRVPEVIQKNQLIYAEETLSSFKLGVPNLLFWQREDNSLEQL